MKATMMSTTVTMAQTFGDKTSSIVMLSAAKHLAAPRARCFAALSMTMEGVNMLIAKCLTMALKTMYE